MAWHRAMIISSAEAQNKCEAEELAKHLWRRFRSPTHALFQYSRRTFFHRVSNRFIFDSYYFARPQHGRRVFSVIQHRAFQKDETARLSTRRPRKPPTAQERFSVHESVSNAVDPPSEDHRNIACGKVVTRGAKKSWKRGHAAVMDSWGKN